MSAVDLDPRAVELNEVKRLFHEKRQNDLDTIFRIGGHFDHIRDHFPRPPKRAEKGKGFNAYVDNNVAEGERRGIGSRMARIYIAAYEFLSTLEPGSRKQHEGKSVRAIAKLNPKKPK